MLIKNRYKFINYRILNWSKMKLRALALFLVFAIAQNLNFELYANDSCATLVVVNDPAAKIQINETPVNKRPAKIRCDEKPRLAKVTASDGKVFTRWIPSKTEFDSVKDSKWNVVFSGFGEKSERVKVDAAPEHTAFKVADDNGLGSGSNLVLLELIKIRQLLEANLEKNPEVLKSIPLRQISSISSLFSPGYYVQIHALAENTFDTKSVKQQAKSLMEKFVGTSSYPHFCKFQETPDSTNWVRVMLGPFKSKIDAKKVHTNLDIKNFVAYRKSCDVALQN